MRAALYADSLTWQYEYVARDHLGNSRVLFGDRNGSGRIELQGEHREQAVVRGAQPCTLNSQPEKTASSLRVLRLQTAVLKKATQKPNQVRLLTKGIQHEPPGL
ncbi:MAG: hypothetical protein D6694_06870 [Gammaproteobacteria bacterium]|nr:MAG: hypothetical protein D6694_06870 [Gammaproteobacteria bacterium]